MTEIRFTDFTPGSHTARLAGRLLHLGLCGSVSCYKLCDVLRAWLDMGIHVSATPTPAAARFISPLLLRSLGALPVYDEMFSAAEEPFGHLEPGQQAHGIMVAPASADFLARLAQGRACDMLSAQALAFAGSVCVAPAMNPRMWSNPATQANVRVLTERGCKIIWPAHGRAACGDEGEGRLAPQPELFLAALRLLAPQDMSGLKVMVTLGPTREYWDGVRFFSNPSSGRMGGALAVAAWLRGAEVSAICGPGLQIYLPRDVARIDVGSARQMREAAEKIFSGCNIGIFCAAVADFAPQPPVGSPGKFKKESAPANPQINLDPNPDILRELAARARPGQRLLGFAAECSESRHELFQAARHKLERKRATVLAANSVAGRSGAFGARESSLAVVDARGREEFWEHRSKDDAAWDLLTWLLTF